MTFDPEKSTVGELIAAVEAGDPAALAEQRQWANKVEQVHRSAAEATRAINYDIEGVSRRVAEALRAEKLEAVERETRIVSAVEEVAARARAAEDRAEAAKARERDALDLAQRNYRVALMATAVALCSLLATVLVAVLVG